MDLCICFQLHGQHTYQPHQPSPTTGLAVTLRHSEHFLNHLQIPRIATELRDSLCDNPHRNKLPYISVDIFGHLRFLSFAFSLKPVSCQTSSLPPDHLEGNHNQKSSLKDRRVQLQAPHEEHDADILHIKQNEPGGSSSVVSTGFVFL